MTERRHAAPSHSAPSHSERPAVSEPSYAERARTLVDLGRTGSLSTMSLKQPGYPFGSVMPYAVDERGRPVFLISTMAMHTQNLIANPRASLLVTQPAPEGDALGAGRVTVIGTAAKVEPAAVRELYLARHENATYWVDFTDFAFWRLELVDVYFVGGFGVMGWVSASDYSAASPDPLAEAAPGILAHMNADHLDALLAITRAAGETEAESATMTAVDRLGFHVRIKTADRVYGARIAFPREVRTTGEARSVLVEMVKVARGGSS